MSRLPYTPPVPRRRPLAEVGNTYTGVQGVSTLGHDNPGMGQACTVIVFADSSALAVNWDGAHSVAGLHEGSSTVTVYCPSKRRLHFSWRIIDMIDHKEAAGDE